MQHMLRYGFSMSAAVTSRVRPLQIPLRKVRGSPEVWQEATDLKVCPPQGHFSSFQHLLLFLFFSDFAKNVFVKDLYRLKSTYCTCSAHEKKNKQICQSSRERSTTPPVQYLYKGFVTLLTESSLPCKSYSSISQQYLPFQTQYWELQSISHEDSLPTVLTLYNLLKILLV